MNIFICLTVELKLKILLPKKFKLGKNKHKINSFNRYNYKSWNNIPKNTFNNVRIIVSYCPSTNFEDERGAIYEQRRRRAGLEESSSSALEFWSLRELKFSLGVVGGSHFGPIADRDSSNPIGPQPSHGRPRARQQVTAAAKCARGVRSRRMFFYFFGHFLDCVE